MEKIVTIDPIADPRWDKFVLAHPYGWICHHSGWKQVLERSFGHMKGHYLAAIDDDSRIRAGLPIFEVRSWLTGNRLVSIPFATLSDPLLAGNGDVDSFLSTIIALSKRLQIPRVEIRTLHSQALITDPRFVRSCLFKYHVLDLKNDPEELRKGFHYKAVRYEINRAQRSGLSAQQAKDEDELKAFHVLHTRTRGRLGLPPQPYRFFRSLWDVFGPRGMITLLLAKHGTSLVAGQLYFKFNNRVSMEFEAWDRDRRHLAPNHFLIWEAVKLFHSEGFASLDFGRTSPSNTSLMDFKRRWGTESFDLPQFNYPAGQLSATDREDSAAYKLVRGLCKRSKGISLDIVGRLCYRHLG